MKIAHVSTFPAMKCGIAFYAMDLASSFPRDESELYSLHYGVNPMPHASGDANVCDASELVLLAERLNGSDCEVVNLQHEFGIWGGENGEHILPFLDALKKPLIATLHTTFALGARPAIQYEILRSLVLKSARSFVLTESSRTTLSKAIDVPLERIAVVPHGIPRCTLTPPPPIRGNRFNLISLGFFRPDKGIEVILQALAMIRETGLEFDYTFAGAPQPQFLGQSEYLAQLRQLVSRLGLETSVHLRAEFLDRSQQLALIQEAHAGVFAYQDPNQSSSGTVPLVLGCGRPVVCTPFEFARAKSLEIAGAVCLASGFSSDALALALRTGLRPSLETLENAKNIFDQTENWGWKVAASYYRQAFEMALLDSSQLH